MLQHRDAGEDGGTLARSGAHREAITRGERGRRATNAGDEHSRRTFEECMDAIAISLPTVGRGDAAMNSRSAPTGGGRTPEVLAAAARSRIGMTLV